MAESIRTIPPGIDILGHSFAKPTARQWRFHILLFLFTIVTTVLSGVMLVIPELDTADPPLKRPIDYLLYVPTAYLTSVIDFFSYVFHQIGRAHV